MERPKKIVIEKRPNDALGRVNKVVLVEGSVETDITAFCQSIEVAFDNDGTRLLLRCPPNIQMELREARPVVPDTTFDFASRDVICGECHEIMAAHQINEKAITRDQADGNYFQFHARDDYNSHVAQFEAEHPRGLKHTNSTSKIEFGEWRKP